MGGAGAGPPWETGRTPSKLKGRRSLVERSELDACLTAHVGSNYDQGAEGAQLKGPENVLD